MTKLETLLTATTVALLVGFGSCPVFAQSQASVEPAGGQVSEGPAKAEEPTPDADTGDPLSLHDSLSGQAHQAYKAARLFYDNRDFARALLKFQEAYDLSKDPRLLWNLAACELKLFHYASAGALMRRYLESDSPLITLEKRKQAHAFVEATERLTVGISVNCSESGARVLLDGEHVGATPLAALRADLGRHEIRVEKDGFAHHVEELTITGSADLSLEVELLTLKSEGRIIVRAGTGDAIALDGSQVAVGSFDGRVPTGRHEIRISAPGSRAYESEVTVRKDRTHTLTVTLASEPKPSAGVPDWAWWVGGSVLAAGAGTLGYFLLRDDPDGCQGTDNRCVQLR